VAVDEISDDFAVRQPQARLWRQTEWLAAATLFSEQASGAWLELVQADVVAAASAVWQYLDRDWPGLWRDKLQEDGTFTTEPSPASSLYHIVTAVRQTEETANVIAATGGLGNGRTQP